MGVNRILLASLTAVLIGLVGCERADEDDVNASVEPTLTSIQTNIFDLNCAISGCHAGPGSAQGLNLNEGESFSNIVNIGSREVPTLMRVNPGNPDQSYLYLKVVGTGAIVGARMPLGRPALTTEEIDIIRQWIEDGAMDN